MRAPKIPEITASDPISIDRVDEKMDLVAGKPLERSWVDALLEKSRIEMERKLAAAGPRSIDTMIDVMENAERDSDKLAAAKEIASRVQGKGSDIEAVKDTGPRIQVTIHKLSVGTTDPVAIPITEKALAQILGGEDDRGR